MEAAGAAAAQEVSAGLSSWECLQQHWSVCSVLPCDSTASDSDTAHHGNSCAYFLPPPGIGCVSMCHLPVIPARLDVTHLCGEADSLPDSNLHFYSSLPKDSGRAPCIHPDHHVLEREQNSLGL